MIQVALVSISKTQSLEPTLRGLLSVPITKRLDGLEEYLAAISDGRGLGNNIGDSSILSHLHGGVLCIAASDTLQCSRDLTSLNHSNFPCIRNGFSIVLISGTLAQFKQAITECCSLRADIDIRKLYEEIYSAFYRSGLRRIWDDHTKRRHTDGTLLIERK